MMKRSRLLKLAPLLFIAIIILVLHLSTSKAFALNQSSQEVVSDCTAGHANCQAVTLNPSSSFELWFNALGIGSTVQATLTVTCDSGDEGFDLNAASGIANVGAGDSTTGPICNGTGGNAAKGLPAAVRTINTTITLANSCIQTPKGYATPYCEAFLSLQAVNPQHFNANDIYAGGHVEVGITVSGSPDIFPAAQQAAQDGAPLGNPDSGGNWSTNPPANEFGLNTGGNNPSYTFQAPCDYAGGKVYIAWSGADYKASYTNPDLGWTLTSSADPGNNYTETGSSTNPSLGLYGDNSVHEYGFTPKAGATYTWQWQNQSGDNEVVYSIPFPANSADQPQTTCQSTSNWSLKSASNVTPKTLTNTTDQATFTHTITNNGPDAASYSWYIVGQYRGANGNISAWSENDCTINQGVSRAGYNCPLSSGSPANVASGANSPNSWTIKYEFPPGSASGDQYCQRIMYSNASGPNDSSETPSSAVCVTYQPPPTHPNTPDATCSWLGVNSSNQGSADYDNQQYYSTTNTVVISMDFYNSGGTTWDKNSFGIKYIGNNGSIDGSTNPLDNAVDSGGNYYINGYNHQDTLSFSNNGHNPSGQYDFQVVNANGQGFGAICGVHIHWPSQTCTTASCPSTVGAATCSAVVTGDGPGGIVVDDGGALNVQITVYNNSTQYAIPSSLNGKSLGVYSGGVAGVNGVPQMGYDAYDHANPPSYVSPYGPGIVDPYGPDGFGVGLGTIEPGSSGSVTVALTEPENGSFYSALVANFAHISLGNYNSQPCGIGFHTYEPFTLNANAVGTIANGNDEDPDTFNYAAAVGGGPTNVVIPNDLQISCVFVRPKSACQSPGYPSSVSYGPGGTNGWGGYYTLNGSLSMAGAQAGDQYCSEVQLAFTTGYIDPQGDLADTGNPDNPTTKPPQCVTVSNKPYFKVFDSNILAGGCYQGASGADCLAAGGLKGWNGENTSTPGVGSGSEFISLLDSGAISGVASGQNTGSFVPAYGVPGNPAGTGLSLANSYSESPTLDTDINNNVSNPNMGGDYSDVTNWPVQTSLTGANNQTNEGQQNSADVTALSNMTTGQHSYIYGSATNTINNFQLNAGTVAPGKNVMVYVYGNVEITANGATKIQYAGDGSWNLTTTSDGAFTTDIPSFTLVATGNISIDPGINELDGLYEAGVDENNGTINTCTGADNSVNTYSLCENQLVVNGSFEANNINLQRTFGSLRDSKPTENPDSGAANLSCSNGVNGANAPSPATYSSCAAEYFDLGPAFYLSSPATELPNGGAVEWQSYDNLPPIL